jgi:hypothetical protein
MHVDPGKRWMKKKIYAKLYPENIIKYKEQLPNER